MNLRSVGLPAERALVGFFQYKLAEGLSPNTIISYTGVLKVWAERMVGKPVEEITADDVRAHLN